MIFPDPGSYPNTASVTVRQANTEATSPPTATATDTVTVVVSTPNTDPDAPTVTLNKIADRTALVAGADDGVVNYDVVITNTSDFPVVITAISDTQYPAIGTHVDHVLAAGGVLTVEYPLTYTVPATYPNTASVTVERAIDDEEMYATSENPLSATASDTETVIVTAAPPPPVVSTGSSSTKYVTPPAEEIVVAGAVMPEPEPEVVVMGAEMPKTGDNSNNLFAILGLLVLAASGILIFTWAKRQKSS